jgi:flagellar protein FliO/FliZ
MTWMIIRLILSLAFVAGVLYFAARLAKKRGLGQNSGLIEVVARQRMGRSSTVNVVRIGDVVLVVGATEQQVTLLAEVDSETVEQAMGERRGPVRRHAPRPAAPRADYPEHYPEDYPEDYRGDHPAEEEYAGAVPYAARPAHASQGALAGSVLDRKGWGTLVHELRERSVRRS